MKRKILVSKVAVVVLLLITAFLFIHHCIVNGAFFVAEHVTDIIVPPFSIAKIHHELLIVVFLFVALAIYVFSDGFKDW